MPPNNPVPGSGQDWLRRAKGDLALARVPLPEGGFYEDLCFHAQQAAEKAIKSVYREMGWTFRYTHDLGELLAGLKEMGLTVPPGVNDAIALAAYAWEARYPGLSEPVTVEEYRGAVADAETVVQWAEHLIEGEKE